MMFGRLLYSGAGLVALAGAAGAQTFVDFDTRLGGNAAPTLNSAYWMQPITTTASGQNRNVGYWDDQTLENSATATNINRVSSSAPVGLGSGNTYEMRWSFIGTGAGTATTSAYRSLNEADTFLRAYSLTANGTNPMYNPVIDTSKLLQFDIWTAQPLRVALIASSAVQTAEVGAPSTTTTSLVVIGGTGADAIVPTVRGYGGYVLTAGSWQTVTVDFSSITTRSLTGAWNPTGNRGALNGLGFTPIDEEGGLQLQHEVYLDNFRLASPVPEPATMLALAAGVAALGARRRRRAR